MNQVTDIKDDKGKDTGLSIISVAQDAWDIMIAHRQVDDTSTLAYQSIFCKPFNYFYINIKGKFELLGTVDKQSISFDVEPYVEGNNGLKNSFMWMDYTREKHIFANFHCETPQLSFYSLLALNGIHFTNTLGEKPKVPLRYVGNDVSHGELSQMYHHYDRALAKLKAWQSAQEKVVDKAVILKQVK